jgi:tRNA U34 5-methylaminomethyl-2-thiouridine-forming methyltransferase MnmC
VQPAKEIVATADGSVSVRISGTGITYHSHYGAIAESRHIFIHTGLQYILQQQQRDTVSVLEIGFGTGLNALLTAMHASEQQQHIHYTTLEPYPLPADVLARLNHGTLLQQQELSRLLHDAPWEQDVMLTPFFTLHKKQSSIPESLPRPVHVVYFDAFAPEDQPELWTGEVFRQVYALLHPGAALVTYCAKGAIRRSLQASGFRTERLPGPPAGKREILRASRPA